MAYETIKLAPIEAQRAAERTPESRGSLTDSRGNPLRKGTAYWYLMGTMNNDTGVFTGEHAKWFINYQWDLDYVIKGSGNKPYEYGLRFFDYDSQSDTSVIYENEYLRVRCDMQYWRKKGNRVKRSGKWSDGHKVALMVADHKWHGIYYLRDVSTGEYVEHHWNGPCTYGDEHKARFFLRPE
ncbi:hypothetical protein [Streptomyces sp. NPDC048282]|uniref:hypothetical protein n=1 Tax=Streptomyces sp. NPDC048282 TaxID=3365528 RepID=UPI003716F2A7